MVHLFAVVHRGVVDRGSVVDGMVGGVVTTGTAWATTLWCCCLQAWVSRVRVICSQLGSPMMISFWSTVLVASTNLATLKHLFSTLSSHLTSVMVMSLVTHTSLGAG